MPRFRYVAMQMYKVGLCLKELTFYKTKPGPVSVINLILQLRKLRLKKRNQNPKVTWKILKQTDVKCRSAPE